MYLLFSSIPLRLLTLIVLLIVPLIICGIVDLEKRKPGHPFKFFMYTLLLTIISILVNRYIYRYSSMQVVVDSSDAISIFLVIITFIMLIVSTYLANKRGYISEKGRQLLSSSLFPCIAVMCLGILFIVYVYFCW